MVKILFRIVNVMRRDYSYLIDSFFLPKNLYIHIRKFNFNFLNIILLIIIIFLFFYPSKKDNNINGTVTQYCNGVAVPLENTLIKIYDINKLKKPFITTTNKEGKFIFVDVIDFNKRYLSNRIGC